MLNIFFDHKRIHWFQNMFQLCWYYMLFIFVQICHWIEIKHVPLSIHDFKIKIQICIMKWEICTDINEFVIVENIFQNIVWIQYYTTSCFANFFHLHTQLRVFCVRIKVRFKLLKLQISFDGLISQPTNGIIFFGSGEYLCISICYINV